uniref:Zinc metalloproteinase n=1 Tax=Strongyloides stercoralis TaxID=6248 RepID=A0A0K0DV78_STRER
MVISIFEKKWKLPIPYYVDNGVSNILVDTALSIIENKTCIKFLKYYRMVGDLKGLRYYYGNDCSSPIGQPTVKIWQSISIGEDCDSIGIIQHETMHSLGIYHEHARYDRDKYLFMVRKNIDPIYYRDVKKVSKKHSKTFGVPFDYGSVLIYDIKAYSKNEQETMIPRDKNFIKTMGTQEKITFNNIKLINMLYCQNICRNKIRCMNGGYQDPNNCNSCRCVKGFTGRWCHFLPPSSMECGKSVVMVKNTITLFVQQGRKNCIYHFFSDKRRKLGLYIIRGSFFPNKRSSCYKNNSVEIKYWNDKTSTGALFCLADNNILILTQNNHAMIYYRSIKETNYIKILLKSVVQNYNTHILRNEFLNENLT